MKTKTPWFVSERAMALASLLLTSRKDLAIQHSEEGQNIDLVVEILKGGKRTLRFFGIELLGCVDLPSVDEANKTLGTRLKKKLSDAALPLCAFLIDVRKNELYYRWLAEPTIEAATPKLARWSGAEWRKLDEETLQTIVEQVNAWYDAAASSNN